jgi:endonuclease/exonuclease/phosphatase family metal-dependent hydrolase
MKLRIATYNIHKGVSAFGRSARIHAIKEAVDLLDADIVFLQEVQGQHDHHAKSHPHWPSAGQHTFLAGDSHQAAYGMNACYQHGHHGNALLSRFPISASTNHDVSDHRYEQRGILHSVIMVNQVEIHCFVIHLGLFAVSRRRQVQKLVQQIKSGLPADAPLIIAGDFNDWSKRLSQTLYQELNVVEIFDDKQRTTAEELSAATSYMSRWVQRKDAVLTKMTGSRPSVHARTFPAGLPWLCLDRVYLRGFQVEQASVLTGAPWRTLSDHVPIVANLRLLNNAS